MYEHGYKKMNSNICMLGNIGKNIMGNIANIEC